MTYLTTHFTLEELACKCGCKQMNIPIHYVHMLQLVRDQIGEPLIVNSGYRCPKYNAKKSSTGFDGPHTKGAFDIRANGSLAIRLVTIGRKVGFTGFGISQNGPHEARFVHLDALPNEPRQPRPWMWSY